MSESIALNLNGVWKSRDLTPGQSWEASAQLTGYDDTNWHPAAVPGNVHTALVEIKCPAPLFYNMNLGTYQWVGRQARVMRV